MKKFLAFIICIVLMCAMPLAVFAEDSIEETEEVEPEVTEAVEPETEVVETEPETVPETIPETVPETVPETTPETIPETTPETTPQPTTPPKAPTKTEAEQIADWIEDNFEEISVVVTLVLTVFYQARKHIELNKSIGTLNNNAVTVAESSNTTIGKALSEVQNIASMVNGYKEEITALLTEVRANEEEKQALKQALTDVQTHLKTAKLANMELANEVAELLVLANIPNSKKEELYARHLAAVGTIADAEKTEVKEDVEES